MKMSSYVASVTVAATALLGNLTAELLFASDSVHPAEIREVGVPGTHPMDTAVVDLAKYGYAEQDYYEAARRIGIESRTHQERRRL